MEKKAKLIAQVIAYFFLFFSVILMVFHQYGWGIYLLIVGCYANIILLLLEGGE